MSQSNLARAVPPTVEPRTAPPRTPLRLSPVPPSRPVASARRPGSKRWPVAVIALTLAAVNVAGMPYYLADGAHRVRHAWHAWFRPSGYVGQSAGILAFVVFTFLWLYPLRKRWKALAFTGSVGKWLDVHVAAALGLPLLLTIHASWRSDGLIGLGFDAMLVVCASGVIGRYLYTRIPRTRTGVELTREEVAKQREELMRQIAESTGLPAASIERSLELDTRGTGGNTLWQAFTQLILGDYRRWRLTRELPRRWAAMSGRPLRADPRTVRAAVRLASREIALTQQARMLESTHRVFRFWHVAHRPFAITALVAVVVHVVVVVAVGSTWFY